MNAVELSLFAHRMSAICEEMGASLKRSAISPNIRDREDFSCALFDAHGELVAQAAHIPVHLGSMAYAMKGVVDAFDWQPGDTVLFNDPFLGGTHLPDITVVMPLFCDDGLAGFAAARAHHADIGGTSPGSMGVETALAAEGLVIEPRHWFCAGVEEPVVAEMFRRRVRVPQERLGDLAAQRSACLLASQRLQQWPGDRLRTGFRQLLDASEAYGRQAVAQIPDGSYSFADTLEDDGLGSGPLRIAVAITVDGEQATVDFTGTAAQSSGPVNCPLSVTAAAVYYLFRCLMPAATPQTSAIFRPITLVAPPGSLVHARPGAAVAAGNVETSQRIVDVVQGALAQAMPERMPAAAQGTMNNVIFGGRYGDGRDWVYYETLAGGMGGHAGGDGLSAVQCHMTNTRNSSVEVVEMHYPLRITRYAIRTGSGGDGLGRGGDGLVREWEVLEDCHLSLLSERRLAAPWGLQGGESGSCGINEVWRDGHWLPLPAKGSFVLKRGERLRISTPGGGGYGTPGKA